MVQSLDWQATFPELGRAVQLRLVLALLAVHRACCGADREGAYAEWLWRVLEGPVGACLTQTPPASSATGSPDGANVRERTPLCARDVWSAVIHGRGRHMRPVFHKGCWGSGVQKVAKAKRLVSQGLQRQ